MKKSNLIVIINIVGIAGALIIFSMSIRENDINNGMGTVSTLTENEPLYWVAPMDPNFRRDEPGTSPMGMELIPVYQESSEDDYSIRVASAIQQNLGLRTAEVIREDFSREISTVGYTRWDESSIQMLYARAEGWLEVFNLASVGDKVEVGQVVYELFAPTLVSAQREYLTAIQSENSTLVMAARDRLLALGFTRAQIEELDSSTEISQRLVYRADRNAIVTGINVREGNHVQLQSNIATMASLETIWLDAEVFESDAGAIEQGLPVEVTFSAFPGEVWESEIAYVYPELDPDTRTLLFRLVINNPEQQLKPNMFANVVIEGSPHISVLTVPREAVIRLGAGSRVILALPEGRFQVQPVKTGISSAGRIEILDGLEEGNIVVSSGQFLIDAEANGEQAMTRLMNTEEQIMEEEAQ